MTTRRPCGDAGCGCGDAMLRVCAAVEPPVTAQQSQERVLAVLAEDASQHSPQWLSVVLAAVLVVLAAFQPPRQTTAA